MVFVNTGVKDLRETDRSGGSSEGLYITFSHVYEIIYTNIHT